MIAANSTEKHTPSVLSLLIQRLNVAALVIIVILFSAMSAVVMLQVFCRYVLNSALLWPEELARYLMIWITFLGSGVAMYKGAHTGVTSIIDRIPGRWQSVVGLIIYAFIAVFLVIFTRYSFKVSMISASDVSPALGMRLLWPRLALPVGSILMLINGIYLIGQYAGQVFFKQVNDY